MPQPPPTLVLTCGVGILHLHRLFGSSRSLSNVSGGETLQFSSSNAGPAKVAASAHASAGTLLHDCTAIILWAVMLSSGDFQLAVAVLPSDALQRRQECSLGRYLAKLHVQLHFNVDASCLLS